MSNYRRSLLVIPTLNYCFGCVTLKSGCLVIGYFEAVLNLVNIVHCIHALESGDANKFQVFTSREYLIFGLAWGIIGSIIGPIFIYGVHKERASIVLVGLFVYLTEFVILTVEYVISGIKVSPLSSFGVIMFKTLLDDGLFLVLPSCMILTQLYCAFVIYSYYEGIRHGGDKGAERGKLLSFEASCPEEV